MTRRSQRRRHRRFRGPRLAALLAAGLLPCAPLPAHAALTENLATSATAMSLGNAVTADPPGIESIHFNPAGLARMEGRSETFTLWGASIRTGASFTQPPGFDIGGWTDDPLDGARTGKVRQRLLLPVAGLLKWKLPGVVIPGLGLAYNNPGSPFTFATLSYIPQAFSVDRSKDPNDPGRYDGKVVQLQRLVYLSPAIGYKFSDTLRVGAAVPIAHAAFVIDTDMRMPNPLLGITGKAQRGWCPEDGGNPIDTLTVGLCSGGPEGRLNPFKKVAAMQMEMTSPVDPTLNLGLLWEPSDRFALGIVYQGGSKTVYSGRYTFNTEAMVRKFVEGLYASLQGPIIAATLGLPDRIPETQSGNMTAVIPFPAHLQIGVKFKPTRRLQLNIDANYTNWRAWDTLTFKFDQSIRLLEVARMFGFADATQLKIPRGYRNVVHWGFGIQAELSRRITLRAGYEPRKSSVPADKIDLIAPLPDTKVMSLGFNMKLGGGRDLNVGASYMRGKFNVPANTDCNLNCSNFFNIIYNPYAGLDVAGDLRVRYVGASFTQRF
ncbi:MAG TPA: outer membrane protein transport protein [Paucimonas sp.]|nr:outer membrane protein transport protein [Paucimonas sp.]